MQRGSWVRPFLVLVGIAFLGQMATSPAQSLISVYVEAELGRSPAFTSNLLSARLVFGAVAALMGGGLCERLGPKRVMVLGATGPALVGAAFLLRSPWAMVLLWAYVGFALGLYTLGRQAFSLALFPAHLVGTAFAIISTGVTLGGAGSNLIAGAIIEGQGFAALGQLTMAIGVLVLAMLAWLLPDRRPAPASTEELPSVTYRTLLRRPVSARLLFLQAIPTSYYGATQLLMPLLIFRVSGSPSYSALYATLSLIFASVGQLVAGRLMDRYGGKRPTLVLVIAIAAISLLTVVLGHSVAGLFFCGITGVTLAWALSVAYPVLVQETCAPRQHSRMLGLLYLGWSAGMLLGTNLGGVLVEYNSGLPFLVLGGLNLMLVPVALSLVRRGAEAVD